MKNTFARLLFVPLIALGLPMGTSALGQPVQDEVPFQALAEGALERHGMSDSTPESFTFDTYSNRKFVHLEVGLFDLYMESAAFSEKESAEQMFLVAASLARLQQDWLRWADPSEELHQEQVEVAEAIVKFLTKPKLKSAMAAAKNPVTGDGGPDPDLALDLWTVLEIKPKVLETFRGMAVFMQSTGGMGLEREKKAEKMVLFPDRASYVEVIALAGWARPEARSDMWNSQVLTWTNFYVEDWRFMAMNYSPPNPTAKTYKEGSDMGARVATGLEQQMTQLGALGLLDNVFGGRIPPAVAGGLTLNLVVDQFGECNTRIDGDLRERRKEAREMFVPGGQSEGGVLPPNLADSRWRMGQGKGHFLALLKDSQKHGAAETSRRERKDKVRYFQLIGDDEVAKTVTEAPVLGSASAGLGKVPKEFYGDRLEFARSYSSAFLYWLRNTGGGKKPEQSQAKFAALLRDLAVVQEVDGGGIVEEKVEGNPFEDLFAKHYDMPLSAKDLEDGKSLEGTFLHWLPKGR